MRDPRPRLTRAQEEAAAWLARLGDHSISAQSVREFRHWRDNPANDAAYEEAEAFWEASGAQAADPQILKLTQAALERGRRRARWRAWLRGPRLAAALTLAAAGATLTVVGVEQYVTPAYATRDIEQKVVRLPDGSRVHLNVDSRVTVAFRGHERRITLTRGEAFFDVAHDAARPFVVAAGPARVRALGTRFDVHQEAGGIEVTLLQGSVQVRPQPEAPPIVLSPNQRALVDRTGQIRRTQTDAANAASWTTGRLVFHGEPLATAVAEVNRYAADKVELAGPGLSTLPVSGFFDTGDTEGFARAAADLYDLALTRGPRGAWRLARPVSLPPPRPAA